MLSNPLKLTFSRLENYLNIVTLSIFLITIFFFLDFRVSSVNNLIFPYLSTSFQFPSWLLSKSSFSAFSILFPRISTLHFLAIIFGYSIFLVNPSCTATDEYCHTCLNGNFNFQWICPNDVRSSDWVYFLWSIVVIHFKTCSKFLVNPFKVLIQLILLWLALFKFEIILFFSNCETNDLQRLKANFCIYLEIMKKFVNNLLYAKLA